MLLYKYVKKLFPTKARQIMQDNSNNLFGGHVSTWVPSISDCLAEDWEILK